MKKTKTTTRQQMDEQVVKAVRAKGDGVFAITSLLHTKHGEELRAVLETAKNSHSKFADVVRLAADSGDLKVEVKTVLVINKRR